MMKHFADHDRAAMMFAGLSFLTFSLSLGAAATAGSDQPATEAKLSAGPQKPVLVAHYMSWYQTPAFSGSWGFWQVNRPTIPRQYWHWPEQNTQAGWPDVASVYCPVIGPYDSADPDTCEYHILLARLAGIDAFVADWYGPDPSSEHPYDNIGFLAMKQAAEKLDFKVMICWEDRSMFPPLSPGVSSRPQAIERGKQMLGYLAREWFSSPAYLRIQGRPVLTDYAYGQAGQTLQQPWLSAAEWKQVLGATEPAPLLIHDWHRHFKTPEFQGYGSVVPWGDTYHGDADRADAFWPQAEAAVRNRDNLFLSGTVLPGFDNRGCGGWGTDGAIGITDRRDGRKFRATWEDVMRHDVKFVQIATWNDLNEGGTIEPVAGVVLHPESQAPGYGYRELETVAEYAGKLKGCQFNPRALRVPEKIYRARKLVARMGSGKAPLPARASVEGLTVKVDQARAALLAGEVGKAEALLTSFGKLEADESARATVATPMHGAASSRELREEELVGPDGRPTMAWHRRQEQSVTADPTRATSKTIKAGLKEVFHETFNRPAGTDLGPGWTQAAHYGVVNEEIRNGRLRFEVLRSEGFPWGSATLNLGKGGILGHGLEPGSYFEITLRRLSGQGDIGIELYDSDQLRVGGDLRNAPSPLQTWNGATWVPISFDQQGQPVSFDWDKVHTLGVRFDSADGSRATFSYYLDGRYAGSWLVATSQKTLDKIGVYVQSKEAGPVFECGDLRVFEKRR